MKNEIIPKIKIKENSDLQGHDKRELPTGIGGVELRKDIKTLPAVEVANEVSWVNNKMNLPFDLKIGKQSPLGMFLTPSPKEGEDVYDLEVSGSHSRSGILGRVIFSDKEGRLYRDIDLKGVGFNVNGAIVRRVDSSDVGNISTFSPFVGTKGIADQELIRCDINFSEKFLKAGIRTHRVAALFDLKEIIDGAGNKISIAKAKEAGILDKKDEPVIEMRAYGVRSRVWDISEIFYYGYDEEDKRKAMKLLSDAKNMVAQELNIDSGQFTYDDYFSWLIKTTAINLARMHYNKWVSGYLTSHNITLDGRFIDLDSVETLAEHQRSENPTKRKSFEGDLADAGNSIRALFYTISRLNEGPRVIINFAQSTREKYDGPNYVEGIYEEELKRLKDEKVPRVRN